MNSLDYGTVWASTCLRSLARLTMRPVQRTRNKVSQEYDGGHWTKVREDAAWSAEQDLRRYLINDRVNTGTGQLVAQVDGKARRISVLDYYTYRLGALAELFGRYFAPESQIVELGCGYGYNLFSLAVNWPKAQFQGFDISGNAVQATQRIAQHFGLQDRIQADVLDATDGKHPNFEKIRGRNLFTFFCIEQIPYDVGKVIENLLAHGPKRVVHAEPGTALLNWWNLRDWPDYLYLRSVDYQNDLHAVLKNFERQGRLRILDARRMPFSPSLQNTGLVTAWEPV